MLSSGNDVAGCFTHEPKATAVTCIRPKQDKHLSTDQGGSWLLPGDCWRRARHYLQ